LSDAGLALGISGVATLALLLAKGTAVSPLGGLALFERKDLK